MALPVVTHVMECADFEKTVIPYLPQLFELPQHLLQSWNNPTALRTIYLATNPLITSLAFSLFLAPIFLVVSEINKNYSQVDRMWSILPTVYNVHYCVFAHLSGFNTERLDNLITFSIVWSIRLTFNFWRKGGYSRGSEDYRWAVLRQKLGPALYFLFNVTFISLAQSVLLFLITTPTYILLLGSRVPGATMNSGTDVLIVRFLMALILVEGFADQEQWNFQSAKKSYQNTAKVPRSYYQDDLDRGFLVTGLWSWSRHPNFAAEQAIWVTLYQWGCYDSNVMWNWTFVGAFGYLILFQGSTWFTERISAEKYPDYKEYQKRVGKFLPKLKEDLPGDFSDQRIKAEPEEVVSEVKEKSKGKKQKIGKK